MPDEKSPLAKAIDAMNEQARKAPPRPAPSTETVRVLVAGVYNGARHKSLGWRKAGEVIEVAGGAYAADLVAAGLVERYEPPAAVDSTAKTVNTETPAPAPAPTRRPRRR
jgi:hypothetical protein